MQRNRGGFKGNKSMKCLVENRTQLHLQDKMTKNIDRYFIDVLRNRNEIFSNYFLILKSILHPLCFMLIV